MSDYPVLVAAIEAEKRALDQWTAAMRDREAAENAERVAYEAWSAAKTDTDAALRESLGVTSR